MTSLVEGEAELLHHAARGDVVRQRDAHELRGAAGRARRPRSPPRRARSRGPRPSGRRRSSSRPRRRAAAVDQRHAAARRARPARRSRGRARTRGRSGARPSGRSSASSIARGRARGRRVPPSQRPTRGSPSSCGEVVEVARRGRAQDQRAVCDDAPGRPGGGRRSGRGRALTTAPPAPRRPPPTCAGAARRSRARSVRTWMSCVPSDARPNSTAARSPARSSTGSRCRP